MQITNTILMVRPVSFRMNEQTKVNNHYQKDVGRSLPATIQKKALTEFDSLVKALKKAEINVIVVQDTEEFNTPDSIFPNNWVSFHADGLTCIYPMFAENRRLERSEEILKTVEENGFKINNILDYSSAEKESVFLEGTGSIVLDRENKIAYCALSPRSDEVLFIEFCEDLEYTPISFRASQQVDGKRKAIYHTNVMMNVGTTFAVICLQTIPDKKQRKQVADMLTNSGKQVINITEEQVNHFAGNMLQVKGKDNESYIVMSKVALESLSKAQISIIEKHGKIIASNVSTIEKFGGGSVRCMMAEVFLPKK
jgi:hypothetical protein